MFEDDFLSNFFSKIKTGFEDAISKDPDKVKEAYESASGVNLKKQRDTWDERAKGYWGEYKVFSVLFKELGFPNKILLNVQIPAENGKTTEIDLILLAPSGIYVFEVKYFSGTVYGGYDSSTWTEYYKTRDSITFENPLKQNAYHLSQLKKMFPEAVLYSYVVFSNPDANVKVGGRYPGDQTVTELEDLEEKLRSDIASRDAVYSAEQIEAFFKTLSKYSPMETNQDEFVKKGQESLPFSSFAEAMLQDLEETKRKNRKEIENEYKKRVEELNKEKAKLQKFEKQCKEKVESAEKERAQAVRSLAEFEKNFVNVTPYESGYGVINKSRFSADVKFEKSDSFEHTTLMYFTLRNNAKELWFQTKNAWIIVGLKNGKSQKYIISEQISNYFLHSKIGPQEKSGRLGIRLFNVFEEEISFIKLCNVTVATHSLSNTNIAPGVEFELYTSPDTKSVYNQ